MIALFYHNLRMIDCNLLNEHTRAGKMFIPFILIKRVTAQNNISKNNPFTKILLMKILFIFIFFFKLLTDLILITVASHFVYSKKSSKLKFFSFIFYVFSIKLDLFIYSE